MRTFGGTCRPVVWLHQSKVHMKRKLWGRRAEKCKPYLGANRGPPGTGLQTTLSPAAPYRAANTYLRTFGATCRPVLWMRQSKVHMKKKLWGRRAEKCKPYLGANSAPTGMVLQTTLSPAAPFRAANTYLRTFGATCRTVLWLHQSKVHMKRKLWGRRA